MTLKIKRLVFFTFTYLILFLSCQSEKSFQYVYTHPTDTNDGLKTGTIAESGLDLETLGQAVNRMNSGRYSEVHSMLIYKDGRLVLEEYFNGHRYKYDAPKHLSDWVLWNADQLHSIMSVTKSITSACIGIAIDRGYIEDVNQSIFDYLPTHQHLNNGGKSEITIEHLLTMTSGLEWYEWNAPYSSPENPMIGVWYSEKGPITFFLEAALVHEPGTHYAYFGGSQIILAEILKNASGMDIDEFSREYLFQPLGIDSAEWSVRFDNGVIEAAGGLKMRPRDMLKIGITFLNNGLWEGQRIISEAWVTKSAEPFGNNKSINIPGEPSGKMGYSYSWWTKTFRVDGQKVKMFAASGWGGQHIMVFPEINMVVVFTGGNYLSQRPPFKILERHILPALKL